MAGTYVHDRVLTDAPIFALKHWATEFLFVMSLYFTFV